MRPPFRAQYKAGQANPIVLGRKFCASCGRWRPVSDYNRQPSNTLTGLHSYCQACERVRRRQWWREINPAAHANLLEYRRFWREANGIKPRRRKQTVVDRPEYRFLPAAPLVAEIETYLASPPPGLTTGDLGFGIEGLAAVAGVPARSISRLLSGQSRHARLDLADKLCWALGLPLALVYGDTPLVTFYPAEAIAAAQQARGAA